jgi:peptidyl-prolyl cis-trans isomerase A (cyclophilin A)
MNQAANEIPSAAMAMRFFVPICALLMLGRFAHSCEVPGVHLPPALLTARVLLDTERGEIAITVDLAHAPRTACNFLQYIAANAYRGGNFGRTVRADNQTTAAVPIAVIQAYAAKEFEVFAPIGLERTRDTGLHHLNGTVSMARKNVDDATAQFFICIGDQPELDFGGRRNPDGQGFAAFGKVTRGMPVILRMQAGAADGERLTPPVAIRAARIVFN